MSEFVDLLPELSPLFKILVTDANLHLSLTLKLTINVTALYSLLKSKQRTQIQQKIISQGYLYFQIHPRKLFSQHPRLFYAFITMDSFQLYCIVCQAPQVLMSDNSSAEKAALQQTWPSARQLLCHFHVAQAEWRWLTTSHNSVDKDQRRRFMSAFQLASFFAIQL